MTLLPKSLRHVERVPVFDPEDLNLCLVGLSQLDRSSTPQQRPFREDPEIVLTCLAAQYAVLEIPRLHRRFDIYCSDKLDSKNTYIVVTREEHVRVEMGFLMRLDFYKLGWWRAGIMRMVGAKYRRLWVGPIPGSMNVE